MPLSTSALTGTWQPGNWDAGDLGRVHPQEKLMRFRFATGISAVVVSIVMVGTGLGGDAVKSGLKPGEPVNSFNVDDITGPNEGKTLCYR
jgi:hypothetical protein